MIATIWGATAPRIWLDTGIGANNSGGMTLPDVVFALSGDHTEHSVVLKDDKRLFAIDVGTELVVPVWSIRALASHWALLARLDRRLYEISSERLRGDVDGGLAFDLTPGERTAIPSEKVTWVGRARARVSAAASPVTAPQEEPKQDRPESSPVAARVRDALKSIAESKLPDSFFIIHLAPYSVQAAFPSPGSLYAEAGVASLGAGAVADLERLGWDEVSDFGNPMTQIQLGPETIDGTVGLLVGTLRYFSERAEPTEPVRFELNIESPPDWSLPQGAISGGLAEPEWTNGPSLAVAGEGGIERVSPDECLQEGVYTCACSEQYPIHAARRSKLSVGLAQQFDELTTPVWDNRHTTRLLKDLRCPSCHSPFRVVGNLLDNGSGGGQIVYVLRLSPNDPAARRRAHHPPPRGGQAPATPERAPRAGAARAQEDLAARFRAAIPELSAADQLRGRGLWALDDKREYSLRKAAQSTDGIRALAASLLETKRAELSNRLEVLKAAAFLTPPGWGQAKSPEDPGAWKESSLLWTLVALACDPDPAISEPALYLVGRFSRSYWTGPVSILIHTLAGGARWSGWGGRDWDPTFSLGRVLERWWDAMRPGDLLHELTLLLSLAPASKASVEEFLAAATAARHPLTRTLIAALVRWAPVDHRWQYLSAVLTRRLPGAPSPETLVGLKLLETRWPWSEGRLERAFYLAEHGDHKRPSKEDARRLLLFPRVLDTAPQALPVLDGMLDLHCAVLISLLEQGVDPVDMRGHHLWVFRGIFDLIAALVASGIPEANTVVTRRAASLDIHRARLAGSASPLLRKRLERVSSYARARLSLHGCLTADHAQELLRSTSEADRAGGLLLSLALRKPGPIPDCEAVERTCGPSLRPFAAEVCRQLTEIHPVETRTGGLVHRLAAGEVLTPSEYQQLAQHPALQKQVLTALGNLDNAQRLPGETGDMATALCLACLRPRRHELAWAAARVVERLGIIHHPDLPDLLRRGRHFQAYARLLGPAAAPPLLDDFSPRTSSGISHVLSQMEGLAPDQTVGSALGRLLRRMGEQAGTLGKRRSNRGLSVEPLADLEKILRKLGPLLQNDARSALRAAAGRRWTPLVDRPLSRISRGSPAVAALSLGLAGELGDLPALYKLMAKTGYDLGDAAQLAVAWMPDAEAHLREVLGAGDLFAAARAALLIPNVADGPLAAAASVLSEVSLYRSIKNRTEKEEEDLRVEASMAKATGYSRTDDYPADPAPAQRRALRARWIRELADNGVPADIARKFVTRAIARK